MKLNSEKCILEVRRGWFLGYMLTELGIEANPQKVEVIQKMQLPRNMQEVQDLVGRVMTLFNETKR